MCIILILLSLSTNQFYKFYNCPFHESIKAMVHDTICSCILDEYFHRISFYFYFDNVKLVHTRIYCDHILYNKCIASLWKLAPSGIFSADDTYTL